jgi:hypothetical protein
LRRLFGLISWGLLSRKDLRANDRFLCRGTASHNLGGNEHTELGDSRSDEYCHYARNIHIYLCNWFHWRQPNGDDSLHTDGDECLGIDRIDRQDHGNSGWRFLGDRQQFLSKRNPRGSLRRLRRRRQRRFSTLHLLREYEFRISSVTGGDVY